MIKVKIFLLIMCFRTFVYWMTWFICLYIVNNPRLDPININSVCFLWRQCEEEHFVVLHIKLKQLKYFCIAFRKLLSQQRRLSVVLILRHETNRNFHHNLSINFILAKQRCPVPWAVLSVLLSGTRSVTPWRKLRRGTWLRHIALLRALCWDRREHSFGTALPKTITWFFSSFYLFHS